MSRQINLYDPALRRQRQWLTALNLMVAAGLLLAAVVVWGAWARSQRAALEAEAASLAGELKALQEQSVAIAGQLAGRKPDPKLEQDLAALRGLLGARDGIRAMLSRGLVEPGAGGYAEYLRGLARQTPPGLWLTGFSVSAGGKGMEIRGRTLDPALLPEYIRRLNGERAFQGASFAALQVNAAPAGPGAGVAAYHEFSLVPARTEAPARGGNK